MDFGNMENTDACSVMCIAAQCGDGFIQAGVETCDDKVETKTCDVDCTAPMCGDGVPNVSAGEVCDDGNKVETDACLGTCKAASCGDGQVQAGVEECDDANMVNTDACVGVCKAAKCGDGFVRAGMEECDDGNMVDNDMCTNACKNGACVPSGARAPLNQLSLDTASGCWSGNPCDNDGYSFSQSDGQNFQGFNQAISCVGASTCVGNVGIATYAGMTVCQGKWDVYCDNVLVGQIDTLPKTCTGSAMGNGCKASFTPRKCATIELRAANDPDGTSNCCGGSSPDSMIVAVSAW